MNGERFPSQTNLGALNFVLYYTINLGGPFHEGLSQTSQQFYGPDTRGRYRGEPVPMTQIRRPFFQVILIKPICAQFYLIFIKWLPAQHVKIIHLTTATQKSNPPTRHMKDPALGIQIIVLFYLYQNIYRKLNKQNKSQR